MDLKINSITDDAMGCKMNGKSNCTAIQDNRDVIKNNEYENTYNINKVNADINNENYVVENSSYVNNVNVERVKVIDSYNDELNIERLSEVQKFYHGKNVLITGATGKFNYSLFLLIYYKSFDISKGSNKVERKNERKYICKLTNTICDWPLISSLNCNILMPNIC
jgi:predicted transposase YbfD/YdcC